MSEDLKTPEIDDEVVRAYIRQLRNLVAEETIETLKMVRLDHMVDPKGKIREYDQQAFRAWVIAWLNSLETVVCAHMAMMAKRLYGAEGVSHIQELVAQPERLLGQVEDIKRALEIILQHEPEMEPEPVAAKPIPEETGEMTKPDAESRSTV